MIKICLKCGKPFTTYNVNKKYCSARCRELSVGDRVKYYLKKKETLCWTCQKATCGCSWSRSFIPVEGWKAEETKISGVNTSPVITKSYRVIECPEYIEDER